MQDPEEPKVEKKGDGLIERIKKKIQGEREAEAKRREADFESRLRIVGRVGKARRWALSDLKRARRRIRRALRRKVEEEAGIRPAILTTKQLKRREALAKKKRRKVARKARRLNRAA